jgi:hypothetical protein
VPARAHRQARIDKDAKERLRRLAFDMWLAMRSHDEIAEAVGYSDRAVRDFLNLETIRGNGKLSVSPDTTDFDDALSEEDDDGNSLGRLKLTDKQDTAKALYAYGMSYDEIAGALSVGKVKIGEWLARTVKEQKDKRDRRIRDLWLNCHPLEDIARLVDLTPKAAGNVVEGLCNSVLENQTSRSLTSHAAEFDPMLYNAFKQQTKSGRRRRQDANPRLGRRRCNTGLPSLQPRHPRAGSRQEKTTTPGGAVVSRPRAQGDGLLESRPSPSGECRLLPAPDRLPLALAAEGVPELKS